jgi:hypothetical protein
LLDSLPKEIKCRHFHLEVEEVGVVSLHAAVPVEEVYVVVVEEEAEAEEDSRPEAVVVVAVDVEVLGGEVVEAAVGWEQERRL